MLLKLKKEAAEEGAFLVRWSALDYHRIILAVLNKNEVSQHPRSGNRCSAEMVKKNQPLYMYACVYMYLCLIEWIEAKPQAVSHSAQGLVVLPGRLGSRILQCEGAHRQPQDLCTQVWFRQLLCQKMLFAKTSRFVLIGLLKILQYIFKVTLSYLGLYICLCDAELSNLLVMRKGDNHNVHADFLSLDMTKLLFNRIKDRHVTQVMRPTSSLHLTSFVFSAL